MSKKISILVLFVIIAGVFCADISAQNRKAVSAKEVNGTYRDYFEGKFKGNFNEIKIFAIGKGKLKISFDLTYPHLMPNGEMTANSGQASGTAEIVGDTAVYVDKNEYNGDGCKITIKFIKPGAIEVIQSGTDAECGFGFNVSAAGTYKKTSSKKPVFDETSL